MSSQLGTELKRSKYRLLGLVGQGQFGRVFCAVHRQTGRLVALKNLEQQRFPTHKFLRELRFLLSLQHDNIVTCQALEHTRTGRYLVMDYCEAGTLRNLMESDSCLSLPQSLKLIADILAGLEHAHSRGIVHCDIKPENILLNLEPRGWTARISDFGIARLSQELMEQEGAGNTGSPAYMAPERFYGQYSLSSDLYSVGVLLFELLSGYRPFSGTPTELMSAHLNQPVKFPETIPVVWQPLILTALQKLSARRFRSASKMLEALRSIAHTEGLSSLFNAQPVHLPLLEPRECLLLMPFEPQQQEILQQPIATVAVLTPSQSLQQPDRLPAEGTIRYQASHTSIATHLYEQEDWLLQPCPDIDAPIQELVVRPQGCFAIGQRSIHLIPTSSSNSGSRLIVQSDQDFVAAIEAQGNWLATVTLTPEHTSSVLKFFPLPHPQRRVAVASQPIALPTRGQSPHIKQLIPLDSRHVAVVSGSSSQGTARTRFEVFTRRGDRIGALALPLQLGQIISTPTPYRLLATDRDDPKSILLIDLKPYRVARFGVEIAPKFLAAATWGYTLLDEQGHMLFLDEYGQQISHVDGVGMPTAIASFSHYGLLIATWTGQGGTLHSIDIRHLGIDLLF